MALDIILLALISFLIIKKLFNQFGKVDESDKERMHIINIFKQNGCKNCQTASATKSKITSVLNTINKETKKEVRETQPDKKFSEVFDNIPNMDEEKFLQGAEDCFEIIINSFTNKNQEIFKLVSETIANEMKKKINDLDNKKEKYNVTIISIPKKEIISAKIIDKNAFVEVLFVSEQVIYKENENNQVIEGSKEKVQTISEVWTFKKDLTNEDPNWIVIETKMSK